MTAQTLGAESAQVIRLDDYRQQKTPEATAGEDLEYCCLYAEVLRASHTAEKARLRLECKERGVKHWWEGPQDIRDRVDANNYQWEVFRAVLKAIAAKPAQTRREASLKRATIGKLWLTAEGEYYGDLRAGCEADDHLFPKSLKLAKEARRAN